MAIRSPPLHIDEVEGRVRLGLEGFSYVEGATLQEASNELVAQLLGIAMALRVGGIGPLYTECVPDSVLLEFIWELAERVARGGDPRELLFGPAPLLD
jgi:hypothetical protein